LLKESGTKLKEQARSINKTNVTEIYLHPSTLAKRLNFLLLLAFIAFYFYGLGHLPLVGPDEPRYAQVAREMFQRNDWITPTLGGHTWFEKPALLYWMEIVAFKIFGVQEWTARLGPSVCGLLTVAAVWFVVSQVARERANQAALIAASCLGLIAFSRGASFDIVVTMTTTWALSFFITSELTDDTRKRVRLLAGFYLFVGLSLLAKGLVGIVVPGGVVGLYYVLRREWPRRATLLSLLWGTPVALLVASAWYGPVIHKHGWHFIDEFFIQHHFKRYLSNKYHHPQPFYFYPAIVLLLTLPWAAFFLDAFNGIRRWQWRGAGKHERVLIFVFAWIVFPVLFFSFSSSKLPGYILPTLPAALIVISLKIEEPKRWAVIATGLLLLVMASGGLFYGVRVAHLPGLCISLAAVAFGITGILTLIFRRISFVLPALAGSILLGIVVVLNCAAPALSQHESTRDLLRLADQRGYSNLRVLALPGDDRSAEFYASGRVIYGPNGEPLPVYDVPEIVAEARKRNERLLAFVAVGDLYLYQSKPGVEIIADNGKLALVCLY
jgi:4-amino-4-deoxy-L-arabinose transferase-like glycosyltransferase